MGGDHGLSVTLPGVLHFLLSHFTKPLKSDISMTAPEVTASDSSGGDDLYRGPLKFLLVGNEPLARAELAKLLASKPFKRLSEPPFRQQVEQSLVFIHTDEFIAMDEKPSVAIRGKKNSSMRLALNSLKAGEAGACVSAGNTGALVGLSRFVLKTCQGISRPAIVSKIPTHTPSLDTQPTQNGFCYMLDLGGNVDSTSEHLLRFAEMGAVLFAELEGGTPRVALLNIGEEEIKGNEVVKEANDLLSAHSGAWAYEGYIEADKLFFGGADVVVCDGFVGNIALKSSEGVARYIRALVKDAVQGSLLGKLAAVAAWPLFHKLKKQIDPSQYNGAILVGLRGNVVKSHGGTTAEGFTQAIALAVQTARYNIAGLVANRLNAV